MGNKLWTLSDCICSSVWDGSIPPEIVLGWNRFVKLLFIRKSTIQMLGIITISKFGLLKFKLIRDFFFPCMERTCLQGWRAPCEYGSLSGTPLPFPGAQRATLFAKCYWGGGCSEKQTRLSWGGQIKVCLLQTPPGITSSQLSLCLRMTRAFH